VRGRRQLLETLDYLRRHRAVTLTVGLAFEVGLMAVFTPDVTPYLKGAPGAAGVGIAVLAAIAAGATTGAVVAIAGWLALYFLVASRAGSALIALPIWVLAAYFAGLLADALIESERELSRRELDRIASHEMRTPLATIAGLARVLRAHDLRPDQRALADLIEDEASAVLEGFDQRRELTQFGRNE
jgi:signal transduction histidine kinase